MTPNSISDPFWPRASAWRGGAHAEDVVRRISILGAPVARGSITPGRCDLAPAAIRAALHRFTTYDIETGGDVERIAATDHGDLAVAGLSPSEAFQAIKEGVFNALVGADALILLGGNNSVTYPGAHGLGITLERCGLLTLDAHLDLRELDAGLTNGNPVRALLADGLPGRNIVQIGLQPFANSRFYHQVATGAGITVISDEDFRRRGVVPVISAALDQLARSADAIYVNFDIDVLDRAFASATPGSRPGGITPAELRSAARLCGASHKVLIADLVEIDPEQDVAGATVQAACMCLLGFASGLLMRK